MDGSATKPLGVALVLLDRNAPPGVAHGAAHLAQWIADDPRVELVSVDRVPAPRVQGVVPRLMRAEARLHRPGAPRPLPSPVGGAPDVVVDLTGAQAFAGQTPRFGVWRLSAHAPGAGFAAIASGAGVTEVVLTAERSGQATPIERAIYGTKPLAGLNAAFIGEKSVQLVCRALAELNLTGDLPAPDVPNSSLPATARSDVGSGPESAPERAGLLRYAALVAPRLAARFGGKLGRLAGRRRPAFALRICKGGPLDFDPTRGVTLRPPAGHFWADPFLHVAGGAPYLFYEDYDGSVGRGLLKVARLDCDRLVELGSPIASDDHLSYPFVFAADGEIWMIPETVASRRIEIWRAVEFPLHWERVGTALDGYAAADSVVMCHNGAWWLFTNISNDSFGDHCAELHLFRADGPDLRRLEPHPLNPVVVDSTRARGAGRVWAEGGRLYRASQNSSHGVYGWGLNVMEITRLDGTGYAERRAREITPLTVPGLQACHHMDFAQGRVVIDLRTDDGA
ncbi:MAG: hypothetical protein AAGG09_19000 [Pseudomonadota bacterium]